jgi:hypothetical protein
MAFPVPTDPNTFLRRIQLAAALTEAGFPIAPATLASMVTRGGGPPYQLFGRTPIYRWGNSLAWARSRLTAPRSSSSEADGLSRHRGRQRKYSIEPQQTTVP